MKQVKDFILGFLVRILLSIDQLANVWLMGDEDNSISSRSYMMEQTRGGWWVYVRKFIDTLFFWDEDHCRMSFIGEYVKKEQFLEEHEALYIHAKDD